MARQTKRNRKKKTENPRLPRWLQQPSLHLLGLFLLGVLLYANTFGHDYAQDDAIVITENAYTQQGLQGLSGIFGNDTFFGFFRDKSKARLVSGGRYRPLSVATFALEYSLFGESPRLSHIINAFLYGACGVVIYLVMVQLFIGSSPLRRAWLPLITTLLFVTHPIHTEAVANIKGRDEILALLGALGGLYFAMRATRSQRPALLHGLGALCLFLGMLSKENAFTFVGVIPLAWYVFGRKPIKKLWLPALPYAAVGGLFLLIRAAVLPPGGGEVSLELMNNPFLVFENGRYVPLSFAERLPTILFTWGKYLVLLFFPLTLTHDYYPRHIELHTWGDPAVLISGVIFLALIGYGVWAAWHRKPLGFAVVFFLVTFLPVSNLLFPIGTNMAERLLFMPSFGWALAMSILLWRLGSMLTQKKKPVSAGALTLPTGLALLVAVLFSVRTIARNPAWADNYTLFTTDIAVSQQSAKLRNAVGGELVTRSVDVTNPQQKETMLREAIGHLEQAVAIHPLYKNPYLLMGNAHNYLQEWEASIRAYQRALQLDPGYEEARNNLAITYRQAGQFYGEQQGDLSRSIQYLQQALALTPNDYEVLRLLGVAHGVGGQHQQAVSYFQQAVQQQPDNARAWFSLGVAQQYAGQTEAANQSLNRARQLDPQIDQKMQGNG